MLDAYFNANLTETDDFIILTILSNSPAPANRPGYYALAPTTYAHAMLLVEGKLNVFEDDGDPYVVEGPAPIYIKPGVAYRFVNVEHGTDPLQPNTVYYIRNKNTPGWDDMVGKLIGVLRTKNEAGA